jgi:hypothetical protein
MTYKQIENLVAVSVLMVPVMGMSGDYIMEKMAKVIIPGPAKNKRVPLSKEAIKVRDQWIKRWVGKSGTVSKGSTLSVDLQHRLMDFLFEYHTLSPRISPGRTFVVGANASPDVIVDLFSTFVGDPSILIDPEGSLILHPNLRDYLSGYMNLFRREVNLLTLVTA